MLYSGYYLDQDLYARPCFTSPDVSYAVGMLALKSAGLLPSHAASNMHPVVHITACVMLAAFA